MSDFSVRSDNVDVEQIMRQIRSRIREKRGVDYTEDEIRELANVKLEKFIDPKGVRSNLLEEYRRLSSAEPPPPNFAFGEETLYETHRAPIRWLRSLLRPFLKLLFNPNPLIQALHIQAQLNQRNAEHHSRLDALHYEVIHNLVLELTRTGAEVKSLKMRLESMASRLDFDERRARALEGVVQYRPGAVPPLQPPTGQDQQRRQEGRRDQGPRPDRGPRPQNVPPQGPPRDAAAGEGNALDNDGNERRARRRRRRGRRRPGEDRGPFSPGSGGSGSFGDQGAREDRTSAGAGESNAGFAQSPAPGENSAGGPDVPRSSDADVRPPAGEQRPSGIEPASSQVDRRPDAGYRSLDAAEPASGERTADRRGSDAAAPAAAPDPGAPPDRSQS